MVNCVKMNLNISFPGSNCQKLIELDDEYEKHTEVVFVALGEKCKGYLV